jgi:phenylpyruvate tautomerase PptA (4-oxalocrotonate tautomerase family)
MPVYSCSTALALSPELKGAIAKEFTRIHRQFTGAPEPFVNIVFLDLPHGSHYLGGAVRENGTLINAIGRLVAPHRATGAQTRHQGRGGGR